MEKIIFDLKLKIVLAILIILIGAVGLYYIVAVYINNSPATQVSTAKNPKDVYIEYLNKMEAASTLENAVNLTADYGYFSSSQSKNEALASNLADLKNITAVKQAQILKSMKDALQAQLNTSTKIAQTINGNRAILEISVTGVPKTIIRMIKDGGAWKITQ